MPDHLQQRTRGLNGARLRLGATLGEIGHFGYGTGDALAARICQQTHPVTHERHDDHQRQNQDTVAYADPRIF